MKKVKKAKKVESSSRYVNPLTDYGFHRLLARESSEEVLRDLINAVIGEEGLITHIEYLPTEQWGFTEEERKAVFDILCKNDKGEYFIIEKQQTWQEFFSDRSLFYTSMSIVQQADRGDWNYELKGVYMISFLKFVLFKEFEDDKDHVIERVNLIRERTGTVFSKKLKFIFVELPKFKKKETELETNVDKWLFVLKNMHKLKERPAALEGEIFDKLFELAEFRKFTKDEMIQYEKSVLEYRVIRDAMEVRLNEGLQKGLKRGRKEGLQKGRKETLEEVNKTVVKKSLQMGLPIDIIVNLTGYSEEQILKLKDKE